MKKTGILWLVVLLIIIFGWSNKKVVAQNNDCRLIGSVVFDVPLNNKNEVDENKNDGKTRVVINVDDNCFGKEMTLFIYSSGVNYISANFTPLETEQEFVLETGNPIPVGGVNSASFTVRVDSEGNRIFDGVKYEKLSRTIVCDGSCDRVWKLLTINGEGVDEESASFGDCSNNVSFDTSRSVDKYKEQVARLRFRTKPDCLPPNNKTVGVRIIGGKENDSFWNNTVWEGIITPEINPDETTDTEIYFDVGEYYCSEDPNDKCKFKVFVDFGGIKQFESREDTHSCEETCNTKKRWSTVDVIGGSFVSSCEIKNVEISPSGNYPDLISSKTSSASTFYVPVETSSCNLGEDSVSLEIRNHGSTVSVYSFTPTNNSSRLGFDIGESGCKNNEDPDCSVSIEATSNNGSRESEVLSYNCANPDSCEEGGVLPFKYNGNSIGAENVTTPGQSFGSGSTGEFDTSDPCYDQSLNNGKGGIKQGCYGFLAPLPGIDSIESGQGLGNYVNIMVNLAIGLASLAAVIMIVWGGIETMTTEVLSQKIAARQKIQNAIIGLLIILGIYLILSTINPNIVNNIGGDVSIHLTDEPLALKGGNYIDPQTKSTAIVNGKPLVKGAPWPGEYVNNRQDIRDGLVALNIAINRGECTSVGDDLCTSTIFEESIGKKILVALQKMKQDCNNCEIVMTAGSEPWLHKTHGPGVAIIDLRSTNQALNQYLADINTLPTEPRWINPPEYPSSNYINRLLAEVDHWHVVFK